jgi:hypothetical protein
MDWKYLAQNRHLVAASREHDRKRGGYVTGGEFLKRLSKVWLQQQVCVSRC